MALQTWSGGLVRSRSGDDPRCGDPAGSGFGRTTPRTLRADRPLLPHVFDFTIAIRRRGKRLLAKLAHRDWPNFRLNGWEEWYKAARRAFDQARSVVTCGGTVVGRGRACCPKAAERWCRAAGLALYGSENPLLRRHELVGGWGRRPLAKRRGSGHAVAAGRCCSPRCCVWIWWACWSGSCRARYRPCGRGARSRGAAVAQCDGRSSVDGRGGRCRR